MTERHRAGRHPLRARLAELLDLTVHRPEDDLADWITAVKRNDQLAAKPFPPDPGEADPQA